MSICLLYTPKCKLNTFSILSFQIFCHSSYLPLASWRYCLGVHIYFNKHAKGICVSITCITFAIVSLQTKFIVVEMSLPRQGYLCNFVLHKSLMKITLWQFETFCTKYKIHYSFEKNQISSGISVVFVVVIVVYILFHFQSIFHHLFYKWSFLFSRCIAWIIILSSS